MEHDATIASSQQMITKILGGILLAVIIGLGVQVLNNTNKNSIIETYQETILLRLSNIENTLTSRTNDRYTSDQANKDRVVMNEKLTTISRVLNDRINELSRKLERMYDTRIGKKDNRLL